MKSSLLFLAVASLIASSAHADVANRVSLTGKISSVTSPTTHQAGTSTTTSSKLQTESITAAGILDALVFVGTIPEKRGYTIVEIYDNAGVSKGFYARNTRTSDLVKIAESLLGTFSDSKLVTANTAKTGPAPSTSSKFTGVSNTVIGNTPLVAFVSGSTKSGKKTQRAGGETTVTSYISTTYTATLGGVSFDGTEAYNAKLVSSGGAFFTSAL